MSNIRVGVACVDYTPAPGLPLMGNFRDDYAARGAHDPLFAKAIVLADGQGTKAAVLAMDICMLDRHNVACMRQTIRDRCDVPPENVLIHATHTHSAPAATGKLGMKAEVERHSEEIERLLRAAASAVAAADRDLADATLAVGYAREDRVSFNRRLQRCDGTTQMNWEALQPGFDPADICRAWGPTDPELTCLTIRGRGDPVAAVVNFGLHPAILAGDNWLYSADYPGYLAEALGRTLHSEFVSLFLNGCCGDVNHVDYRDPNQGRGFQMAQRVGYMLAATAHEAIRGGSTIRADELQVSRQPLTLQRLRIGPDERQRCVQILREAQEKPPKGQVDGLPDAYYAELRLEMHELQHRADQVEVMVLRIGDAAIVGLPGEAFCQLGLEIKRRSPARHTLVAGLCNDAIGYLPTREAFERGGYETTTGSTFYEPGTAEQIVASALGQLDEIFSTDEREPGDSFHAEPEGDG
jgi:hypothetical protein